VGKGNIVALENFNKVTFFRSCLRNPRVAMKGFHVGGLVMNPSIIAFIIVCIITPRGHNHYVLHEEDLILMYCILNQMEVNWAYVLGEQMMRSKRLVDYKIPYVVLVLKLIEYFCVPLDGELSEHVKQHHEVTTVTLHKIGLNKINDDHWVCQADTENAKFFEENHLKF